MKKILIGIALISSMNVFSAQILNNKIYELFPNREVRSLISGNYNLEKELVVTATGKIGNQVDMLKLENDAKLGLKTAIQKYAYDILKDRILGVLVTGPGFDESKMKEFSKDIGEKLVVEGQKRGTWSTSKGKNVVLYTISKNRVKAEADMIFNERVNSVIEKLNEYKTKMGI